VQCSCSSTQTGKTPADRSRKPGPGAAPARPQSSRSRGDVDPNSPVEIQTTTGGASGAAPSQDRDVTSRGVDCRIGHRRIRREGRPRALYLARSTSSEGCGCRSTGPHPVRTALAVCSCCFADTAPRPSLSPMIATRQRPWRLFGHAHDAVFVIPTLDH